MAERCKLVVDVHEAWWVRPSVSLVVGTVKLLAPVLKRVAPRLTIRLAMATIAFVTRFGVHCEPR